MRIARLSLGLVASGLSLTPLPLQAAPSAQTVPTSEAPVRLVAHRAVYDLALSGSSGTRAVDSAQGRIVIDFSGDACRGFTVQTRQVTALTSAESVDRVSDLRSSTYEGGDGRSFRFKTASLLNGKASPTVDGNAETAEDGLKIKLKEPKREQLSEAGPVLFPSHHMRRLIEVARAGDTTLSTKVFDGSDDGRKVYDTLAVIGRATAAPANAKLDRDKPLREGEYAAMRRWPVTLSYFTAGAGERTPIYTLTFDLYENGISGGLHLDYGGFSLDGNMSQLELHKSEAKSDDACTK